MKTSNRVSDKFYSINHVVNANAMSMVDGSKWISWALARKQEGLDLRRINKIAQIMGEFEQPRVMTSSK